MSWKTRGFLKPSVIAIVLWLPLIGYNIPPLLDGATKTFTTNLIYTGINCLLAGLLTGLWHSMTGASWGWWRSIGAVLLIFLAVSLVHGLFAFK